MRSNAPEVLARNPDGAGWQDNTWRKGAFEVIDEETSELLFSKLQTGTYASPKGDGSRPLDEEATSAAAMEASACLLLLL